MKPIAHVQSRLSLFGFSSDPVPLVMDSLRMMRRDYNAECGGLKFNLKGKCGEWFTVVENVIREDYFKHGITLAPGDTVIDIGANFGSFTAAAARRVSPTGVVISFEPDPITFQRLLSPLA